MFHDIEGLLERLEDKLPVEEPEVQGQDLFIGNYDSSDPPQSSNSAPSWAGEAARPPADMGYSRGSWTPPEKISPLKNKLRELLNAPRSMRRSSDCFGSRIDRIGSQSGMGCGRRFSRESEAQQASSNWLRRYFRIRESSDCVGMFHDAYESLGLIGSVVFTFPCGGETIGGYSHDDRVT
ncbi:unnamed protein product [Ranitomeya imitator]|uniref:Natriuretic peptides A n=1 Tax=Ranitomeya imitator TaxID=111125 RepID=A0ABN9LC77_9NEOB|nr:unnamed protein product [Ranitomeya imitator]